MTTADKIKDVEAKLLVAYRECKAGSFIQRMEIGRKIANLDLRLQLLKELQRRESK